MRNISNTTGSFSGSSTSGKIGNIGAPSQDGKDSYFFYEDVIPKANTVPLKHMFKHYNLRINEYHRKMTCPFKSHKGGRETTPSFYYYPDQNSFKCYGCGIGNQYAHSVEFMAAMENISKFQAAMKILNLFGSEADDDYVIDTNDMSERLEIMMEFSNLVREFRQSFSGDHAHNYIEYVCRIYDRLCATHEKLDNEALRNATSDLKTEIQSYNPSRIYIIK
jgi:hypothetical protein